MKTPKNWLCLTTSDKELENMKELTRDIWDHFDGIAAVVHKQGGGDEVVKLLNERKKQGFVIERPFPFHHGHSKNEWLFDRRIGLMDCCWIRDSSERFNPKFTATIAGFAQTLLDNKVWNLAQWSKLLMFRRWFNQQFFNGLHWGLSGAYGGTIAMDKLPAFQNERDYAYSVRNDKRPADHRYHHEVSYLIDYAANGNHLQLFHNDPNELDTQQWHFFELLQYLAERGVTTAEQLRVYLEQNTLDNSLKFWLNQERPLRNFYRHFILKHTNEEILRDEDTWRIE